MENNLSEEFFLEWIETLGDFLNKKLDPKVSKIYYNRLKKLTDVEFLMAIEKAITQAEQFKFPSADTLIEYALGTPQQRAYANTATHPADMPRLLGAPESDHTPIALPGGGGVIRPNGCPAGDNLRGWHLGRLKCSVDAALFCRRPKTLEAIKKEILTPESSLAKLGITWEEVQFGFCHAPA